MSYMPNCQEAIYPLTALWYKDLLTVPDIFKYIYPQNKAFARHLTFGKKLLESFMCMLAIIGYMYVTKLYKNKRFTAM